MIIKSIKDTIMVICIFIGSILLIVISVKMLLLIMEYILFPSIKWITTSQFRIIASMVILTISCLFLTIYSNNKTAADKSDVIPLLSKSEKLCVFCLDYARPRCSMRYDEMTLLHDKDSNLSNCRYFKKDVEEIKARNIKNKYEKEYLENKIMK